MQPNGWGIYLGIKIYGITKFRMALENVVY